MRRWKRAARPVGGQDAADRLLRRVRFLPRTAQIGLRNVARRRRRSMSTALVIAFAVGTLLAVLGLAAGAANASRASWGDHGEDVKITAQGHRRFDAAAASLIAPPPGSRASSRCSSPTSTSPARTPRSGPYSQATMFHYRIAAGRWYTPAEEQTQARVAVVERAIARVTGTRLGDTISVQTASGPVSFRVIGIATNQQENGTALFVPLTTMHALMTGMPADDNDYWVRTTSHNHALIDATTTRIRKHPHRARLPQQQRDQVRQAGERGRQLPDNHDHARRRRAS